MATPEHQHGPRRLCQKKKTTKNDYGKINYNITDTTNLILNINLKRECCFYHIFSLRLQTHYPS